MPGSANTSLHFLRMSRSCEHCGNPIADFDKTVGRLKCLWSCVFAVKNFTPKPLRRIRPADFCHVLRAHPRRGFSDLSCFCITCMVLPKPYHCCRIMFEIFIGA